MRACFAALVLAFAVAACGAEPRLVAPLNYAPAPPTPDDPSRARPPEVTPDTGAGAALAPETFDLDDGVHVVFVERHNRPVLAVELVVARGAADLDTRRTTTRMLVEASLRGTATRSAQRLVDDFDALGGPLRSKADPDGVTLSATTPATSLDGILELLADVVMAPALAPNEMGRLLERWKAESVSTDASLFALYGEGHPYRSWRTESNPGEDQPSAETLQKLHDTLMHPRHATLVVVGDTTRALVEAAARRWLGTWPSTHGPLPTRRLPDLAAPKGRSFHIEDDTRTPTAFAISAPGPAATAPDQVALEALMSLLAVLARDAPRAGAARAFIHDTAMVVHREDSYVRLNALAESAPAAESARSILAAVAAVRDGEIAAADLATVRAKLLAKWRHDVSESVWTAFRLGTAVRLGIPLDTVVGYPARVAALTTADVQRVARRYLADENLRIVVLGRADEAAIGALGFGPAVEVKP